MAKMMSHNTLGIQTAVGTNFLTSSPNNLLENIHNEIEGRHSFTTYTKIHSQFSIGKY